MPRDRAQSRPKEQGELPWGGRHNVAEHQAKEEHPSQRRVGDKKAHGWRP